MLESYALTDPGKVRTSNQDFYRVIPELGLYLLADGMGGARGGERASQLAVDSVADAMAKSSYRDAAALLSAVEDANRKVLEEASRDPKLEGMGTTLVAVLETDEHDVAIASVGDSRAYVCHGGRLRAVTEDQTWIQEVGRPLGLDEDVLRTHPMRHVLTMAVGVGSAVRIRYYAQELTGKDIMMLSSDGLHGVAPVERMEEILADDTPLEQKCRALIEAAHEAGSPDNITVILLRPAK
jgi:protein phosphatase